MGENAEMKKFTARLLLWLIAVHLIETVVLVYVSEVMLSKPLAGLMYSVPVAFVITGVLMALILNTVDRKNSRGLVQVFMIIKSVKNVMIVLAAIISIYFGGVFFKHFLIVAGSFYFIYLIFETIALIRFEKLLKRLNEML